MKKMFAVLGVLALVALAPLCADAQTKSEDRIIAVVNENVITMQDLDQRFLFMARNLGRELDRTQRRMLLDQALNTLIEEELNRQFADEQGIRVSNAQVDAAVTALEQRNRQPQGSFLRFVGPELKETALAQVKDELIRTEIIKRFIIPRVTVTPDEVDSLIKSMLSKGRTTEREISQIFIPVTDEADDAKAREVIQSIFRQLSQGAGFEALARTYSKDRSAAEGGYIGWVSGGELSPAIESSLNNLQKGATSEPVRGPAGWHIVKVLDTRETTPPDLNSVEEVRLVQLHQTINLQDSRPMSEQVDAIARAFEDVRKKTRTLAAFEAHLNSVKNDRVFAASGDMGWLPLRDLPQEFQTAIEKLKKGQFSQVVKTDNGVHLFYLADRRERPNKVLEVYRTRVTDRLVESRGDRLTRRFLRDLRRKAYIDIRL
jgi:peptidyl-prolyl cis-trans isomerase SurA